MRKAGQAEKDLGACHIQGRVPAGGLLYSSPALTDYVMVEQLNLVDHDDNVAKAAFRLLLNDAIPMPMRISGLPALRRSMLKSPIISIISSAARTAASQ